MYIHFITFGCKVNTYETACMTAAFEAEGFTPTLEKKLADIFVINSCTVTSESDSKLRQTLRGLRRGHPEAVIVLTGCYPQAFPEEAAAEGCADIVTGTKNRGDIVRLVKEYLDNRERICSVSPYSSHDGFEKMSADHVEGHTRAFMKIQDGCNAFCTYCIIPYSRGRIRSKTLEDIVSEAKGLAENGYKEIVLVGINLAFYGAELGTDLADAAEAVSSVEGIERIRLGSLEPEKLTDNILDRLAALPKFCPSFHLSLQSGCGKTLRAMNRRYTPEEYEALVCRIREKFPDCGITADVMAGFPEETEENHRESLEFVKKIGFSDIHVFPYSRRKGTKADLMEGQVPADIKKRRAAELAAVGANSRREFMKSLVGKDFPVLFERERSDGIHHGYTPNYVHVKILTKSSEKSLRKMIFYVKIDKIGDDCCFGEIIRRDGGHITNIQ
ncbi:MAG: tRNA (N(6)-L-threonylcarbamoyladenosine(37)-C(2))-methylthiotransferase MtaB [Oscillospiraceae bacterium]|nr:tRNA (N(6)-L-threonylcarbamoyladenosine(37)-C(2))-methylthiotransferase MtaB [Oscillospiraceae bacterium]